MYIHNVGFGETEAVLTYHIPGYGNDGTGTFVKDNRSTEEKEVLLKVVNGDTYLKNLKLNKINLIKIDVEGFEREVLLGLQKTLHQFRPVVMMEFTDYSRNDFIDRETFYSLFPKAYHFYEIKANREILFLFNRAKYKKVPFKFSSSSGNILIMLDK